MRKLGTIQLTIVPLKSRPNSRNPCGASTPRQPFRWALQPQGISNLLVVNKYLSYFYDLRYTWQSVLFLVFAVSLIFAYWPKEKKKAADAKTVPVKSESEEPAAARPSDQPAA